jgi:uncharacterized protein YdgA (DUF945 family)
MLASPSFGKTSQGLIVKKGIVVLLVLLAVVVLVSPAIVGRLAEQSMDDNLNWAASESGDVKVTSEHFTRGWFSSEGQHRIELQEGDLLAALQALAGPMPAEDLPVLIINTRLDHGLIPVTSMGRDKGSLAPGLGSAISTMQVELPDGEIIDVPGTIYSKVALGGQLRSNYVLETGSRSEDGVSASWGNVDINVTTDPGSGAIEFDGALASLSLETDQETMALESLSFDGQKNPTRFGVSVGDIDLALENLSVDSGMGNGARVTRLAATGSSALDGDRLNADGRASMAMNALPLGAVSYEMDFSLDGVDATALGALQKKITEMNAAPDPMAVYATVETDAQRLFAAGFDFNVDRLEVTLPQGTISLVMRFSFAETDPASFSWSSLLLNTEASIDLAAPVGLVETFAADNPQAALVIGGGYLVKRGEAYVTEARLKKGLLTVNGAPIPLPLGTM